MIDRRSLLARSAAALALGALNPTLLHAATAATNKRFVFIIQRGAADGLHIVPPMGDPAYGSLRAGFLDSLHGAHQLDATFSLHPSLTRLAGFYDSKQMIAVQAVASTYRDRSHFDGQNILETGGTQAYAEKQGWMNRLLPLLPDGRALALAADIPMALRGAAPVSSYAPSGLPQAQDDLMLRVNRLYGDDPQLSALWTQVMQTKGLVGDLAKSRGQSPADLGRVAARMMAGPDGARVLMMETGGWDTHTGQTGRLATQLDHLDTLMGAMVDGLGPAWHDTLVLVATEFGRTAAINGTNGTDHGTGSAAMLVGGDLQGGRVMADWPGVAQGALYEARDLRPTLAMEALISGALAQHFGLDPALVARRLYPAQQNLRVATI
ncbi:MAG: DUF1501 domain-containing protein [Sphingomonadales bacterium]|nr:DUF1501 domain-containing protein [Sphingomonadales bacterium]MDE2168914.1 DUF1501 domain-containing protein [Sphingomonadales bacterium]